jgi:molybdate-binding protein
VVLLHLLSEKDIRAVYNREWGFVVPKNNPRDVTGIESLLTQDIRFVNRFSGAGLRETFEAVLSEYGENNDLSKTEVTNQIRGFENGVKGHASPAHVVRRGTADVGLGLRETAESLGLGFVSLGYEAVRIIGNQDRREKQGVQELHGVLDAADRLVEGRAGYRSEPPDRPTSTP